VTGISVHDGDVGRVQATDAVKADAGPVDARAVRRGHVGRVVAVVEQAPQGGSRPVAQHGAGA
jgi:hypothetical protein